MHNTDVHSYAGFVAELANKGDVGDVFACNFDSTAAATVMKLQTAGKHVVHFSDPCLSERVCKNDTELAGFREAHVRDGVALCRFLLHLNKKYTTILSVKNKLLICCKSTVPHNRYFVA